MKPSPRLSAVIWALIFISGPVLTVLLLANPFTTWIGIILLVLNANDRLPFTGGYHSGIRKRLSSWYRRLAVWKSFREYFPSKLIIKGKLEENGKYVLSYHPHGVIGLGVFTQFVYDFEHLVNMPKIRPVTLNANLSIPFLKQVALLSGFISCDYDSMKYVLQGKHLHQSEPQESVLLVTGGGFEAEFTKSKTLTVAINNRSGFIRLCMETGAKLVPVIGFGECDTFYIHSQDASKSKFSKYSFMVLQHLQRFLRKHFGFSLIYFYGEPVLPILPFPFNLPIVPRKSPLTVVVGDPISMVRTLNPTTQQIETVREEFKRQVRSLVAEHGDAYGIKKVNFQ